MAVEAQVHERFKVFVGSSVAELDRQVQDFTADGSIAPKSIGVEFLEGKNKLVLSLGYRADVAGYATKLLTKEAGVVDVESPQSLSALAATLEMGASAAGTVICHELFVKSNGEVHAVFLARA